ncbi:pyridoxamine 5'-phosphate oxidase family protein [Jannaschia aquimarina]|uniref:Pyridoxamine 5'-phosphate oxidase n=1 Tax=Jannaschia aquimarina TaxID=935700 RepID=A0A0D1EIE4_9RHOB|nr:pyridoxamine 5'-phosphate oxidase family protein [Jannaschia aquimarina]KIT17369.1 Pyridoxamine 5'-phosphate oxidase [Jannaschia aquimarina]SNS45496.1 Pyridoxamine 5'-phosphate oxidase [Jannaschia aquimarina]
MSDGWASLDRLEDHLWSRIERACSVSDDPWRLVALATIGQKGPQVRTVALRACDRSARAVEMHTDARTPKARQIGIDPRAQILLWDPNTQEQLRLSLDVEIVRGDRDRWSRIPEASRGNYGTDPTPGTPIAHQDAFDRTPALERHAALVGRIVEIDAVNLSSDPHLRAQWNGMWVWVAP